MIQQLKQMYVDAKQVHRLIFEDLVKLTETYKSLKLAEQVDTIYALKKISELLDDTRKECDKLSKQMQIWATLLMHQHEVEKVKTSHCTAKSSTRQFPNFPHKRTKKTADGGEEVNPQFDEIMNALNIPADVIESEAVRLNWQGFADYFTARQANGQPLLEGIDPSEVYTEYTIVTRKIKDVDEE